MATRTTGGFIIVFGLWLLTPFVRRGLGSALERAEGRTASSLTLGVPLLVSIVIAVYAMFQTPHDQPAFSPIRRRRFRPRRPRTSTPANGRVMVRTQLGQRYSPLAEITPANVGSLQKSGVFETATRKVPTMSAKPPIR